VDSEDERPPPPESVVAHRVKYVVYAVATLFTILWLLFIAFVIYFSVTVESHEQRPPTSRHPPAPGTGKRDGDSELRLLPHRHVEVLHAVDENTRLRDVRRRDRKPGLPARTSDVI
jgi:hypothetical protein